jgi:hypothetical protein
MRIIGMARKAKYYGGEGISAQNKQLPLMRERAEEKLRYNFVITAQIPAPNSSSPFCAVDENIDTHKNIFGVAFSASLWQKHPAISSLFSPFPRHH